MARKGVKPTHKSSGELDPAKERILRELLDSVEDWGPTSWRDIDRLVYGGDLNRRERR